MAEETQEKKEKKSWIQTIPGALGATTAFMTAASGLIVALQQVNILKPANSNSNAATSSQVNAVPASTVNTNSPALTDFQQTQPDPKDKGKGKGKNKSKD